MSIVRLSIVMALVTLLVLPAAVADAPIAEASGVAFVEGEPLPVGLTTAIDSWQSATAARRNCIETVTVRLEPLEERDGEYRTAESLVVVDVGLSPEAMRDAVVHELAHHVFVSCRVTEDATFTAAFYSAQGIPVERGWYDYSHGWEQAPSELFAEAVTHVVLGHTARRVDLTSDALEVVQGWLVGI